MGVGCRRVQLLGDLDRVERLTGPNCQIYKYSLTPTRGSRDKAERHRAPGWGRVRIAQVRF